ncbi:hypothetical protein ACI8AV_11220 [Geodermatophilus sp. SYSU D00804]
MFAQVIQGRTTDTEAVFSAVEDWVAQLSPTAEGWLGSTTGVTDDGWFVTVVRFESADAARRNSDRPEQGRWWEGVRHLFEGEPAFLDSEDVTVDLFGDPDRAGFVQVMQGQTTDLERARELVRQMPRERLAEYRPDVLATMRIGSDDGRWVQVTWFTSEDEAREGERREPPAEWREVVEELTRLAKEPPTYLDLRGPLLHSRR